MIETQEDFVKKLRILAKSSYWQTVYTGIKDLSGFRLFKNDLNFSSSQLTFINLLSSYNTIFIDIALNEVGEIVLENPTYEEAYLYYKSNKDKKKKKEEAPSPPKPQPTKHSLKDKRETKIDWVFQRPKGNVKWQQT